MEHRGYLGQWPSVDTVMMDTFVRTHVLYITVNRVLVDFG